MGCSSSKYEVFIRFRGADVRNGFLSHLFTSLKRKKIKAFKDENLKRGEEITTSLVKTIKKSQISIVIFSQQYAYSPWCLDELLVIKERMKKKKQIVIPVFYHVDPSDVQELRGNYGSAIAQYNQNPQYIKKVKSWKLALKKISNLSGFDSDNPLYGTEAELIAEVVEYVSKKLNEGSSELLGAVVGAARSSIAIFSTCYHFSVSH